MNIRPVDQWTKILGDIPAPEGQNTEILMANRIIGDLAGYRHNSQYRARDARELASAMVAYGRMMFDANVRP